MLDIHGSFKNDKIMVRYNYSESARRPRNGDIVEERRV